jgi:hypothetical protein
MVYEDGMHTVRYGTESAIRFLLSSEIGYRLKIWKMNKKTFFTNPNSFTILSKTILFSPNSKSFSNFAVGVVRLGLMDCFHLLQRRITFDAIATKANFRVTEDAYVRMVVLGYQQPSKPER